VGLNALPLKCVASGWGGGLEVMITGVVNGVGLITARVKKFQIRSLSVRWQTSFEVARCWRLQKRKPSKQQL